ncbi:MAG: molybdate ABC transporter substrate-binding protein [Phaeospirillum sp.]|nr:molybdate ABC transporter substrate-binding protein [Phaeospirillum sp.]
MRIKQLWAAMTGLAIIFGTAVRAEAETVTIFAAASTANAVTEIGELFKARTGDTVRASYASSSTLAKQIERGAPAQLFLSADLHWMEYLAGEKLITPGSRANLLGNALVLIAPLDAKTAPTVIAKETDLVKLLGDGHLSIGDPDHVPAGIYARQALEHMGQWAALAPRLARGESVRAALALVERGETPLGIVYSTDAALSVKVKAVGVFPDSWHDAITYPVALIAGTETPSARAFLEFLKSDAARNVFSRYGFKLN